MQSLADWTEIDLQQLIADAIPESLVLDYKASPSLTNTNACRNELSKDVSAFANSAGGRIIYGIVEKDHKPDHLDHGVPPDGVNREWVEQVISSTIQPRVPDIVIKPIQLSSGGTAYVIDIPQSTTLAPHQANDRKYYKRLNFECQPMYDYEVRDVMRRSTTGAPEIWCQWHLDEKREREGNLEES